MTDDERDLLSLLAQYDQCDAEVRSIWKEFRSTEGGKDRLFDIAAELGKNKTKESVHAGLLLYWAIATMIKRDEEETKAENSHG